MSYARYRQDYVTTLLPGSVRTNGLIIFSIFVPALKSVTLYNLRVYMSTAGTAATTLTIKQDAGSVLATTITSAAGHATWDLTAPLVVTGAASTGSKLQIFQVTTDVAGVGTAFLDMEKPFI